MPAPAFKSFVIFAGMRTGSNLLESNLNALGGITCYGEVFNPYFIGAKDELSLCGVSIAERDENPLKLWSAICKNAAGLPGFRFFHDHDPRMMAAVMADPTCAKIVLTRNPLDSYVSWKIAHQTGQWKTTGIRKMRKATPVEFDGQEFEARLAAQETFGREIQAALQISGQTAFYLDYDDLGQVEVLNGLAAYLGVPGRLSVPESSLKKQNPGDLADKLTNPGDVGPALARLDRFNLGWTPSFEQRRPPAIPSFVAAGKAGLLYMPIKGGPEEAVRAWLGAATEGDLVADFTQKSLRQWLRAHPRHCSFTVLRHPLLRAYAAFRHQILPGHAGEARAILGRMPGFGAPGPDGAYRDLASERKAFGTFLDFVRMNLAGQTGARVNPHWASQAAVLQGFAQFQGPDVILREDRLAAGLGFVAGEAGLPANAAKPGPEVALAEGLAAIHDNALEEAAEAAYARDYLGFGFGRWKGGG